MTLQILRGSAMGVTPVQPFQSSGSQPFQLWGPTAAVEGGSSGDGMVWGAQFNPKNVHTELCVLACCLHGPVFNRPQTGSGPRTGDGDPYYRDLFKSKVNWVYFHIN